MRRSVTVRLATQALALALVLGATAPSWAEKGFCKVINSLDMPGKTKLKDSVGMISLALAGIKAVLAVYYGIDQKRAALAEGANDNAKAARTLQPMAQFFGWVKWILKSFIPYNKTLASRLMAPDKIVEERVGNGMMRKRVPNKWRQLSDGPAALNSKSHFKTGFSKVYPFINKFYIGWTLLAASVEVLQLSALGACKNVDVYCTKKKCSARVQDNALDRFFAESSSRRQRQSTCATSGGLDALWGKFQGDIEKMARDGAKLSNLLRKIASPLAGVHKLLEGTKPALKAVNKVLGGLSTVMKPIHAAFNKINKLMDKKLCVMPRKCFRVSDIPKQVKKFSKKLMKPVMKKVDKLFQPIINKVLKKLKIPGLDSLKKVVGKLTGSFGKIFGFMGEIGDLVKLPLDTYAKKLKAIAGEIAALN